MLRATLKHVTGARARRDVMVGRGGMFEVPDPTSLGIVPDGAGFALLRYDAGGVSLGHSWHPSVHAAMAHAGSVYGIAETDWQDDDAGR